MFDNLMLFTLSLNTSEYCAVTTSLLITLETPTRGCMMHYLSPSNGVDLELTDDGTIGWQDVLNDHRVIGFSREEKISDQKRGQEILMSMKQQPSLRPSEGRSVQHSIVENLALAPIAHRRSRLAIHCHLIQPTAIWLSHWKILTSQAQRVPNECSRVYWLHFRQPNSLFF
jgi:hypothetical protein